MAGIGNSGEMAGRASSSKAVKGSYKSTYAFTIRSPGQLSFWREDMAKWREDMAKWREDIYCAL
jgi:hypothetical protein